MVEYVIATIVTVIVCFLLMYRFFNRKTSNTDDAGRYELLLSDKGRLEGEISQLQQALKLEQEKSVDQMNRISILIKQNSEYETTVKHLRDQLDKQEKNLEDLQKRFTVEFENVANKIFEEKTQKFTVQNKENLGELLKPFSERIKHFETTVRETQVETAKERTSLAEQIKQLTSLNNKMLEDAQNLTKALKGDNKAQGNWGEFVLERILEVSGLIKDQEYYTQHSDKNAEGNLVRPDIVIKLPEEKHLIIDSKVSLVAYEAYINSEDDLERERFLKEHLLSMKTHVKQLSEKNYQSSVGLNSPEFVLLFVPIESSFSLAIQTDNDLYKFAWEKKVVIVSPSTLLATLRTIASVWKQERQTKNAAEIARQAGTMYDKFVSFLDDLEKIGRALDTGKKTYDEAFNKLKSGRGNLIGKSEKLRELGAKVSKRIPVKYLDDDDKPLLDDSSE